MNASRPTDWWKGQAAKVQAAAVALFDDAEVEDRELAQIFEWKKGLD